MRIPRLRSLGFRLTIWYVLILAVLIAGAGTFVYRNVHRKLISELDEHIEAIAEEVQETWWHTEGLSWQQALERGERDYRADHPLLMVVKFDKNGSPLPGESFISRATVSVESYLLPEAVYRKLLESDRRITHEDLVSDRLPGSPFRVVLVGLRGPYLMQVGVPWKDTRDRLNQLMMYLSSGGFLLLVLASLGGHFIVQRALRPMQNVVQAAQRISAEDLSHRIDGHGRQDEIGSLIETFNDMLGRLETSVGRIRRFTADVSHELRTPLTIIRGEIEVCLRRERDLKDYQGTLRIILEETELMSTMIDDLLLLSRLDTSKGALFQDVVQLDEVLLRAFERREPMAAAKRLHYALSELEPLRVRGDGRLLDRLLANLIDNAIRYTPEDGRVDISLSRRDSEALVKVQDTGVGIPAESIPLIFDRFYVVDSSRSRESGGAGLGLSIVTSIADLHGARIDVQSVLRQGTTFTVSLPIGP